MYLGNEKPGSDRELDVAKVARQVHAACSGPGQRIVFQSWQRFDGNIRQVQATGDDRVQRDAIEECGCLAGGAA
jgi:hypothetical protein